MKYPYFVVAQLLVLLPCASVAASGQTCLIVGVTDGDTITARCPTGDMAYPYSQIKVRLSAIDAPEKKQPFGERSRQALAALCFQQQAAIAEKSTDRYGRTVADVSCQGKDAGQHMVGAGMAWVYNQYAKGYGHLYPIQDRAKAARLGLWSESSPTPPWEWRRTRPPEPQNRKR
ncbi:MAG: thermonuclease family protein [Betaproteobacteria bacterium]|nr:thermonuclease family protein [Betaproteobacteria bacterium]